MEHPRTALRNWRTKKARLTLESLASILDCSPQAISFIENGRNAPSLELAFKIQRWTGGAIRAESWVERCA